MGVESAVLQVWGAESGAREVWEGYASGPGRDPSRWERGRDYKARAKAGAGASALQPQEGEAGAVRARARARAVPACWVCRAWPGTVQHQVLLKEDGLSSSAPRPGCSFSFWAPLPACLTSTSCRAQLWTCLPSNLSERLLLCGWAPPSLSQGPGDHCALRGRALQGPTGSSICHRKGQI